MIYNAQVALPAITAGVFSVAFILRRRRKSGPVINHELFDRLEPFAAIPILSNHRDKHALWAAIGGGRGLWAIVQAAGEISSLSTLLVAEHPEAQTAKDELFMTAIYLRGLAMLCYAESWVCDLAPACPRIIAFAIVRNYCEMVFSLTATFELCNVEVTS